MHISYQTRCRSGGRKRGVRKRGYLFTTHDEKPDTGCHDSLLIRTRYQVFAYSMSFLTSFHANGCRCQVPAYYEYYSSNNCLYFRNNYSIKTSKNTAGRDTWYPYTAQRYQAWYVIITSGKFCNLCVICLVSEGTWSRSSSRTGTAGETKPNGVRVACVRTLPPYPIARSRTRSPQCEWKHSIYLSASMPISDSSAAFIYEGGMYSYKVLRNSGDDIFLKCSTTHSLGPSQAASILTDARTSPPIHL